MASEAPKLPPDVEERWSVAWGDEAVQAARRQVAKRPSLDLTFADNHEAPAYASANDCASLASNHVRLNSASVTELPGFGEGRWWVQDLAASLPARLIPRGAREVLDLCAAPGGKTMQLAAAGHEVTSLDASENRLTRLQENLQRTHLSAKLVAADALQWEPRRTFDAILLDAPCSATGTFRRHPEVLYRARPRVIASAAELESRLLHRAAEWLEPRGALLYSVCSLEPEEGEEIVSRFLEDHSDFKIDPPKPAELPDFVPVLAEGWVRILPGLLEAQGGLDGFFMARLVRRGS